MVNHPVILIFVRCYLPGYKSGGPVRTIANIVDHLGDDFNFCIVTSDRDVLDEKPYPDVDVDAWNRVGKADVYYASPSRRSIHALARLITDTPYDLLYLNSFFDPIFTLQLLLARRMDWTPKKPVVIAPRGEFSAGALALKHWKKKPYLTAARLLGLYENLTWQASSEYEQADIERAMGRTATRIAIAPDLPAFHTLMDIQSVSREKTEPLRVVFLSRISPKKNLDFALRVLRYVTAPVEFNIYGPQEDQAYWRQCESLIDALPKHIQVRSFGAVPPHQVSDIMASHDLFFLPTRGENYGHVIAEALSAGTPVLISDTTAWRGLEQAGVGWDLSLAVEWPYAERINECAAMDAVAYQDWRTKVQRFSAGRLIDPQVTEANRSLFLKAINQNRL